MTTCVQPDPALVKKSIKTNFSNAPRRHAKRGTDTEVLALGVTLRDTRIAAGLTQDQLSLVSGVSRDTVMALENGRGGVSIANALRVFRALGLQIQPQERT